ncbi:MAG: type II secretion system F family protein [Firmicutes bacterium]|nr:type II secretion system F family protein [Bacillota bacterium]
MPIAKSRFFLARSRPGTRDLMIFCRQFAAMNNAGITLLDSLRLFGTQMEQPVLRERLRAVAAELERGGLLAESLAMHDDVFPALLINMVEAGEEGGVLDTVLDRLALHFEKQYDLEQKIKAATFYPKFLTGLVFLTITFILMFVLPNFVGVFENMGLEMPLLTGLLFAAGELLTTYWHLIALSLAALYFVIWKYLQTEKGARYYDRLRLIVPFFSSIYRKVVLARFCRILGILLSSGMTLLPALELLEGILENVILAESIQIVRGRIVQGRSLAETLAATGFFPLMIVEMVRVGEMTGNLENLLDKVADFYEADLSYTIDRLQATLEPVLILTLAGVVAFIALSVLMPIFEMYQLL